ncbi:MAG: fumarate hydratase C-terminal domain-containing protein [Clostridia bacterium]|nr:fumarate hydratase C-terminal domain-containing protein [Clostridia bacterium]
MNDRNIGEYRLNVDDIPKKLNDIHAGDVVYLSGTVYTARDAAHKKIISLMEKGEKLPFDVCGSAIYYAGPTPEKDGQVIGSCGPTTSSRMDMFTVPLIEAGLCAMIGKGKRSKAVIDAMKKHGAVYFCAVGGAGALAASHITSSDVIAFPELGCEAVRRLVFKDFPLIVGIDASGQSIVR